MKRCPYCAEKIQEDAIKCRFCGEWLKKEKDRSESAKTSEEPAKEEGLEVQTVGALEKKERKRLPTDDIPKFGLGNMYIALNLFLSPVVVVIYIVVLLLALPLNGQPLNLYKVFLSIWMIFFLGLSFFVALKLRKGKRYAFVLNSILLCFGILGGICEIIWGKGIFMARLGRGGLFVWFDFGWLVYFYTRRQYFNA